jgi:NADPH:quinone reductase-like Zn-dependent oxidoreductase
MIAALVRAPGEVQVVDVPVPELGPGEVLIV